MQVKQQLSVSHPDFMSLIDRIAEAMTGIGEREWGNDTQQRPQERAEPTAAASIRGTYALPTELPKRPR